MLGIEKAKLPFYQPKIEATKHIGELKVEIKGKNRELAELQAVVNEKHREIAIIYSKITDLKTFISGVQKEKINKVFIVHCPKDKCNGFLNDQWVCSVCNVRVCRKCREPREEEHTCDPEIKESVKLIKKCTKPCPECGTPIHKIAGCDQMWCVQCNTAFSWSKGTKINGGVHNPHYFEWLNRGGTRRENDQHANCGFFNYSDVSKSIKKLTHIKQSNVTKICESVREMRAQCDRFTIDITDYKLAIEYSFGEITEDKWKKMLVKNDTRRRMAEAQYDIIRVFCDVANDILVRMCQSETDKNELYDELTKLRKFVNDEFRSIAKRYNSKAVGKIAKNTWKFRNIPRNLR
jgi:hypothetical protein